jgi:hypothetical protein
MTQPPTPYRRIAEILKERHAIDINPSSIWSFVRARDPRRQRNVYRLPEEQSPASPPITTKSSNQPLDPLDTEEAPEQTKELFTKWKTTTK